MAFVAWVPLAELKPPRISGPGTAAEVGTAAESDIAEGRTAAAAAAVFAVEGTPAAAEVAAEGGTAVAVAESAEPADPADPAAGAAAGAAGAVEEEHVAAERMAALQQCAMENTAGREEHAAAENLPDAHWSAAAAVAAVAPEPELCIAAQFEVRRTDVARRELTAQAAAVGWVHLAAAHPATVAALVVASHSAGAKSAVAVVAAAPQTSTAESGARGTKVGRAAAAAAADTGPFAVAPGWDASTSVIEQKHEPEVEPRIEKLRQKTAESTKAAAAARSAADNIVPHCSARVHGQSCSRSSDDLSAARSFAWDSMQLAAPDWGWTRRPPDSE